MNERDKELWSKAAEATKNDSWDEQVLFMQRFADLIRADEREACAKVCEEQYEYYGHDHVFAKAIRARSNT